jgi:hypothetical protein
MINIANLRRKSKGASMLFQVLYSSLATEHLGAHAMRELLAHARERNAVVGITGVLIYYPESREIVQVLEGPKPAVLALLEKLRMDPRHQRVVVHFEAAICDRDLGTWPMGFLSAQSDDAEDCTSRPEEKDAIGGRLLKFIRRSSPPMEMLH